MDRAAAFTQLYDAYRDRIYRMCCYYVPGEGDRKDLYQEVMTNLWKGLDALDQRRLAEPRARARRRGRRRPHRW